MRERAAERLAALAQEEAAASLQYLRRVQELEAKIANLVAFIAAGNGSSAVAAGLRALEEELAREKSTLSELGARKKRARPLPTVNQVVARVRDLGSLLASDPIAGREALRAHLSGAQMVVHKVPDGSGYIARGELIPVELLVPIRPQNDETGPEGPVSTPLSTAGSGGPLRSLETQAMTVPWEVLVPRKVP